MELIRNPEVFLINFLLESDGNPIDGEEWYSWTEDAAKLNVVMNLED